MPRILLAGIALFVLWKFQHTPIGLGSFPAYVIALLIEERAVAQFRLHQRAPSRRTAISDIDGYWEPSPRTPEQLPASNFATLFIAVFTMMVMADSFFMTNWLDLPEASNPSHGNGFLTLLKGITSLLCLATALIGPVVLGVFTYIDSASRQDSRSQLPAGGIAPFFSAALVTVLTYGHFYVAHQFYDALGALRPS
ncbi:hypothetical protein [Kitasatospora sp. Ki12]